MQSTEKDRAGQPPPHLHKDRFRTYIVYPIAEIAEILDKSTMTIQNSLKELDIAGLLERERRGFSAPNRLYVKVPEVVKVSLDMTQRGL